MFFLRKHQNLEQVKELQELFSTTELVVIELFAEIVAKCKVKPDEGIKTFTLKAMVKMYIQVSPFFQSFYYSEVFSVRNCSEEFITKTSQEWNLLKR